MADGFKLAEAFAEIRTDMRPFVSGQQQARKQLLVTQERMNRMGRQAKFLFAGLAGVVGLSVKAAGDAAEIENKFQAVFKDQAAGAAQFADELGEAVGRSTTELKQMLSTVQDTFVPMGFARKEAAQFSEELTTLAIDVASFNNAADADVMRDFQSALVGNHETVRRYGIVITQARLEQELLRMGMAESIQDATEQQKVLARLNIIMAGTADAHGDAAKTAGSFNNQLKATRAALRETVETLGEAYLPAIRDAVAGIGDWLRTNEEWLATNQELIASLTKVALGLTGLVVLAPKLMATVTALKALLGVVGGATLGVAALAAGVAKLGYEVGQLIYKLVTWSDYEKELNEARREAVLLEKERGQVMARHESDVDRQAKALVELGKRYVERGYSLDQIRKKLEAEKVALEAVDEAMKGVAKYDRWQSGREQELEERTRKISARWAEENKAADEAAGAEKKRQQELAAEKKRLAEQRRAEREMAREVFAESVASRFLAEERQAREANLKLTEEQAAAERRRFAGAFVGVQQMWRRIQSAALQVEPPTVPKQTPAGTSDERMRRLIEQQLKEEKLQRTTMEKVLRVLERTGTNVPVAG